MDFEFTREQLAFREEVEEFAKRELPPGWGEQAIFWLGQSDDPRVAEFLLRIIGR